ncbi:MAG: acetyltransferase [Flavobacteriaceae bacterium]|nr:acetyltransferase [Flavobacteriaceae bacterium]|tara:strand:+ start:22362 stop:22973 length:612 start_codon:yes stop_codon:yes gene_type:complete
MTNNNIIFIGYSGHSYGCIEVALSCGFSVNGYCDILEKSSNPYNLKYFGHEDTINSKNKVFISIGDNTIRRSIYEKLYKNDFLLNTTLIHPSSTISKSSLIEEQTLICASVIINPQVKIGVGCIINTGAIIEHECLIGKFTHIAPGAVLCGNVKIGSGCMIGANAVVKQDVKIGDNVTIGAGSVVLNDINSNTTFVGNPAKEK